MRSHSCMTSGMLCSTRMIVSSYWSRIRRIRSRTTMLSLRFMPAVGSSSRRSVGLEGQRAHDLQPALVAVGQRGRRQRGAFRQAEQPQLLEGLLPPGAPRCGGSAARTAAWRPGCSGREAACAETTFSSTVMLGNRRMFWKVRPMPSVAIRSGGRRVMSRPWKRICPLEGRRWPVSRLNTVDLPAPLGPMMPRISPGQAQVVVRHRLQALEGLRQAFDLEQVFRHRPIRWLCIPQCRRPVKERTAGTSGFDSAHPASYTGSRGSLQ